MCLKMSSKSKFYLICCFFQFVSFCPILVQCTTNCFEFPQAQFEDNKVLTSKEYIEHSTVFKTILFIR